MRRSLTARVLAAGALLALAAATAARAQGVDGGRDEARASEACGCGVSPFPCDAYGAADAVFAGVVAAVDPVRWSGDGKSFSTRGRVTRFEVGEAFRGVSPGAVEVSDRGTLNDYRFTAGEEYFVYARRDPQTGKLYVCTCSHTKRLMFAEEDRDLAYARAVAGGELTPSIVGRVSRLERAGGPSAFTNSAAVEGIVVTAEGAGGTFETASSAAGEYSFCGLPAGDYTLRARLPHGAQLARPDASTRRLKVADGRCAVAYFGYYTLASIKGRAVEWDGAPAVTKVSLVPLGEYGAEIRPAEGKVEAETDALGRYRFDHVAPGRYLVAVNPRGQPASDDAPYPRAYLPGLPDKSDAQVITVTGGEEFEANEFRLPPPLRRGAVEGVVRRPDGRPAAGAVVVLEFTSREWTEEYDADAEGRFSIDIYEGFEYLLTAEVRAKRTARHSQTAAFSLGPTNEPLKLTVSRPGYYVPRYARRRASN